MTETPNTWSMHAHRYENGQLWHVGHKRWVQLHGISCPIVAVLVEQMDCDPTSPEVTHYGWWDLATECQKESTEPTLIYPRTGRSGRPDITPWMLLGMCFAYGIDVEASSGKGRMVCLRITEVP